VQYMLRLWGHELSPPEHTVQTHMITVRFDDLRDEEERRYFKHLPTSFVLTDKQIDRLTEAGRRLLRDSPQFQQLVRELR
jgi:NTE family protein